MFYLVIIKILCTFAVSKEINNMLNPLKFENE